MRIGVTGGRDYRDRAKVAFILSGYAGVLVHGDAPGADRLAADWWRAHCGSANVEAHPALWDDACGPTCGPGHRRTVLGVSDRCPAKGPLRNQEMVDSGLDLLIAFPGGRGTADMVRRAKAAGVPVLDPLRGAA